MKQKIIVKQCVEAFDEQIIPLLEEGMFLEGDIHIDDVPFYLSIRNQGSAEPTQEFYVSLKGESEFFVEEGEVDADCHYMEVIKYIEEFRSNPHQFAETYGN